MIQNKFSTIIFIIDDEINQKRKGQEVQEENLSKLLIYLQKKTKQIRITVQWSLVCLKANRKLLPVFLIIGSHHYAKLRLNRGQIIKTISSKLDREISKRTNSNRTDLTKFGSDLVVLIPCSDKLFLLDALLNRQSIQSSTKKTQNYIILL